MKAKKAPPPKATMIRPRIYLGESLAIGPGKIELLRQVDATRSISAAARSLGLTYKRAWLLVDAMNQGFGRPVVETATGGKGGGGTSLTPLGTALIARYDALESRVDRAARTELDALLALIER